MFLCLYLASPADKMFHVTIFSKSSIMCLSLASPADKMFHMSIFSKSSWQNVSCVYLLQVQQTKYFMWLSSEGHCYCSHQNGSRYFYQTSQIKWKISTYWVVVAFILLIPSMIWNINPDSNQIPSHLYSMCATKSTNYWT